MAEILITKFFTRHGWQKMAEDLVYLIWLAEYGRRFSPLDSLTRLAEYGRRFSLPDFMTWLAEYGRRLG
jgi:hypothetical protein